ATDTASTVPIEARRRSTRAGPSPAAGMAVPPLRQRLSLNMTRAAAARVRNTISISARRKDSQTSGARTAAASLRRGVFAIHARPALAADAAHLVAVRERKESVPLADDVLEA